MPRTPKTKVSAEQLLETALNQRASAARLEVALLDRITEKPGISSQELANYFGKPERRIRLLLQPYVKDGIVKKTFSTYTYCLAE